MKQVHIQNLHAQKKPTKTPKKTETNSQRRRPSSTGKPSDPSKPPIYHNKSPKDGKPNVDEVVIVKMHGRGLRRRL